LKEDIPLERPTVKEDTTEDTTVVVDNTSEVE
jgi:hypothetical protein